MTSNGGRINPLVDTRDDFFTTEDYESMSCTYYMVTTRLEDRRQIVQVENKTDVATESKIASENVQACKAAPVSRTFFGPVKSLATLSVFQHKMYLDLKTKYGSCKKVPQSAVELQDLQLFAGLEESVQKERDKVNEYLYSNACTSRRKDYFHINPEGRKYITEILKEELQYSLQYPRYYSIDKVIPLLVPGNQMKETSFTLSKVVVKLGSGLPFIVPYSTKQCLMHTKYERLKSRFPPENIGAQDIHPSKQHISRDSIAHNLAVKYEADVVITLDSLKVLMDNVFPALEHNWEVPIIIFEDEGASGNPYKCIYVEKPLPPASISVRAKNVLYYSYSMKFKFTQSFTGKSRRHLSGYAPPTCCPDDIQPVAREVQVEVDKKISDLTSFEEVCEFSEKVCELDTFGVSAPKKSPRLSKSSEMQNPVHDEDKPCRKTDEEKDSDLSSEDLSDCVDQSICEYLKEVVFSSKDNAASSPSKSQDNTASSSIETKVAVLNVEDGAKNSGLKQCTSPFSSPDLEQGGLVIDCDNIVKQPDCAVTSISKDTAAMSGKMDDKNVPVASSGLVKCQQNSDDSENEAEILTPRKRRLRQLSSDFDNDSGSQKGVSDVAKITPVAGKCRKSSDAKILESKKLLSPKSKTDNENKVPKNKSENNAAGLPAKSTLDMILMSQHKMLKPEDEIGDDTEKIIPTQFIATDFMDEVSKQYPQLPTGENVQYALWRLGGLKVLLRSEVDALISSAGQPSRNAFLFPKLEYQVKFGYEVTSASELMRHWVALHTHPGSRLIRARIDATKALLAMLEDVSLSNLLNNNKDLNPKHATHQLFLIFDTLKGLSEGQYLLSHKKGEFTVTLQRAVPTSEHGAFDLHGSLKRRLESVDNCEDVDPTRKDIPWLPIDPSISLPEQVRQDRIPGCFFPIGFRKAFVSNKSRGGQKSENKKTPPPQMKKKP